MKRPAFTSLMAAAAVTAAVLLLPGVSAMDDVASRESVSIPVSSESSSSWSSWTSLFPLDSSSSGNYLRSSSSQLLLNTSDVRRNQRRGPSEEEMLAEKEATARRIREQRERARRRIQSMPPNVDQLTPLTQEEINKAVEEDHPWVRRTSWWGDSSSAYNLQVASPGESYDKWQQAYRMLGAFIDCDHQKSQNNDKNKNQNNNNNNDNDVTACSRWMVWAAYVDPNYQGNGYYEYFGDNPVGKLDCHSSDTEWVLLGVYRQEFYQFIEQISKHLWAIDDYEYIVAVSGLSYMTKYECFQVGTDSSGNTIYASIQPQPYGKFQMALYTENTCVTPNTKLGKTYDDFGLTTSTSINGNNNKNNGNNNNGNNNNNYYSSNSNADTYWQNTQEYTFSLLNDVYEPFKYCTSCVDYPTYQDGYFIGTYGTDDDDLINQCWKFYSHSSYTCEADCIAQAHAQGSLLSVNYGGTTFGYSLSDFDSTVKSENGVEKIRFRDSKMTRVAANGFLTCSFVVFVATFLAFAVARRSRIRDRRTGRSRRLLDEEDVKPRSSSSRRSKSRENSGGDGLFRSRSKSSDKRPASRSAMAAAAAAAAAVVGKGASRSSRATSASRAAPSSSRGASSSRRSKSKGRSEPVSSSKDARKSSSRKSRRHMDDF